MLKFRPGKINDRHRIFCIGKSFVGEKAGIVSKLLDRYPKVLLCLLFIMLVHSANRSLTVRFEGRHGGGNNKASAALGE